MDTPDHVQRSLGRIEGRRVTRITTENNQVLTISVSDFSSDPGGGYYYYFAMECGATTVLPFIDTTFAPYGYSYSSGVATWTFTDNVSYSVQNIPTGTSCQVTARTSWPTPLNVRMGDYYRGGSLVPNIGCNSSVPTAGQISISDFYGACLVP